MTHIVLPQRMSATGLVALLAGAKDSEDNETIQIDFSKLQHITPTFLAAVTATVQRWENSGRQVVFSGLEHCQITGYLQRMDFLRQCGIELAEGFRRHDSRGRFVPVRLVEHRVEELAKEIAECFAAGGEDYDHANAGFYSFLFYSVTEMGNNVRQHSGGRGFTAVQSSTSDGMVRLALADNGCGILRSFQRVELPWSKDMTDADAILKAMEPRISSKSGPFNEGVGLTILSSVMEKMKGWLMVASGTGMVQITPRGGVESGVLPNGGHYQGTLVSLTVRRSSATAFNEYLHATKFDKGLLPMAKPRATFQP